MNRSSRAIAMSAVCVVIGTFLPGCRATDAVLGIRQAPRANTTSASLTVDQAKRILVRAFTAARQGETRTGAAAQEARGTAYTGQGLRAANARFRLAAIQPPGTDSPLLAPQQPRLLAVSRGFGFPRFIVAQSVVAPGSLPSLHLLTSPDAATPYRISASATMLLATSVKPFAALTKGSSLESDRSGLASDTALLTAYAVGLAFPAKALTNPPFAADVLAAQVRAKAAAVAKAVATQASFSQVHKVVPNSVYAVRQAGGDALVFGVIERTDSFRVKSGQAVNTSDNKAFVLLSGKKRVTKSASITWLEFVVFAVPRSSGRATLVAASEQVVAGSGS